MNHLVKHLCNLFEQMAETEQAEHWQPLIYPLVWHEVNVISQRRYFTRDEWLNLEATAKYIARYVILPPVKEVEFDVLLEESAFRGLVLGFFHDAEIHTHFAQKCDPTARNEISFLNSLTHLWEQVRLFERGIQEVIKRIRDNSAAYYTLGVTETGAIAFTQRLQNELAEQTSWMSLPEYKRLDTIGTSVQDWLYKLVGEPVMERYKKSFLTALNVKRDLIDAHRRLKNTKKGRAEAGTTSLYEEVETKDGDTVPMLEIIPAPPDIVEIKIEFTEQQKEALREFLNEVEVRILEAILHDFYATQEEIAQQVGCSQSKVSKTIIENFKPNMQRIKKILEIS